MSRNAHYINTEKKHLSKQYKYWPLNLMPDLKIGREMDNKSTLNALNYHSPPFHDPTFGVI